MELVELMSRVELNQEDNAENEAVAAIKKKVADYGAKSYILRSTLQASLIESAALRVTGEAILEEELVDLP